MAIIPELGITVVIHANGQPLTEYDDPEPSVEHPGTGAEIRTCHKFVQSVDGANFSVEVQAVHVPQAAWLWESPKTCLRFVVYVDGARASGTLVSRFDPSQSCSKSFKGRRRDDRWIQKFTFSRIQTGMSRVHLSLRSVGRTNPGNSRRDTGRRLPNARI